MQVLYKILDHQTSPFAQGQCRIIGKNHTERCFRVSLRDVSRHARVPNHKLDYQQRGRRSQNSLNPAHNIAPNFAIGLRELICSQHASQEFDKGSRQDRAPLNMYIDSCFVEKIVSNDKALSILPRNQEIKSLAQKISIQRPCATRYNDWAA